MRNMSRGGESSSRSRECTQNSQEQNKRKKVQQKVQQELDKEWGTDIQVSGEKSDCSEGTDAPPSL